MALGRLIGRANAIPLTTTTTPKGVDSVKAHTASLINAIVLIAVSSFTYLTLENSSFTMLVPALFGVALLACNPGVKAENKLVAHIAVALTLLVFLALLMPLTRVVSGGNVGGMIRVGLMQASTLLALVFFIKSFMDARRSRA